MCVLADWVTKLALIQYRTNSWNYGIAKTKENPSLATQNIISVRGEAKKYKNKAEMKESINTT